MDLQKFSADIKRCLKHYRANNSNYDGQKASEEVANMFQRVNDDLGTLGEGLAGFWLNNFIRNSADPNEPTEKNCAILEALQAFIDGDGSYLSEAGLTQDQWEEIKDNVNSEAEDLPLDVLQDMMSIILDNCEF